MSQADRRSPQAAAWRHLYWTTAWRKLRAAQLARRPLCELPHGGKAVEATVANHKQPHKGDVALFFDPSNLQSVCKPHHDGTIQRSEAIGFSPAVDTGGWPTDPKHPSYRSR